MLKTNCSLYECLFLFNWNVFIDIESQYIMMKTAESTKQRIRIITLRKSPSLIDFTSSVVNLEESSVGNTCFLHTDESISIRDTIVSPAFVKVLLAGSRSPIFEGGAASFDQHLPSPHISILLHFLLFSWLHLYLFLSLEHQNPVLRLVCNYKSLSRKQGMIFS